MRCFKKVAFPKRPELKWHEMVTKTMMLSCVNTIFLNNLSLTEHIIPFWKLIHLRKISLWRLLLLRKHEKVVANHACALLNRLKKYKKKPLYININIYKTVNPSKRVWMQVSDICCYSTEIHVSGYSLTSQIQICITP